MTEEVSHRQLVSDPALLTALLITFISALAVNTVPLVLPSISEAFDVSEAQVGLVMSAFSLPTIVTLPLIGVLADMYGRRYVAIPSLFLFGLSGVSMFFVDSFGIVLLVRGIQGIAFAGTLPFTITLIGDLYTGTEGSAAQGIRSGTAGVANTIAPILGSALVVVGWQYPFLIFVLAVPLILLMMMYYPPTATVSSRRTGSSREILETLQSYWYAVREETRKSTFAALIGGGFILFFIKQGIRTFVPVFIVRVLGAPVSTAGLILGAYGFVRVILSPLTGVIMAKMGRKTTIGIAFGSVILGVSMIPFMPDVTFLSIAVIFYSIGEAILNPVLADSVAAFASDEHRAGIVSAFSTVRGTSNVVSPIILGVALASSGFAALFIVSGILGLIYLLGFVYYFNPGTDEF